MAETVPCPGCKSVLTSHCPRECGWAVCSNCSIVYGPTHSMPLYTHTKKRKA